MFYTWKKITDPDTGWLSSKTAGWTADSFSGGLEVDFSSAVPAGTKAVRVMIQQSGTHSNIAYRKSGDTNISNTPIASQEWSHLLLDTSFGRLPGAVIWLSSDYKAQFAVGDVNTDLSIAYPIEYLS